MISETQKNGIPEEPEYTGRYLILLPDDQSADHVSNLKETSGLNLLSSTEFEDEIFTTADLAGSDGIVLDKLGIAIVNSIPEKLSGISALGTEESPVIIEPERVVYALNNLNPTYLKGYVDAVNNMAAELLLEDEEAGDSKDSATIESVGSTWGLQACGVIPTIIMQKYSGKGIKVAVLDTGFEFSHPDFSGRNILQQSFVSGQSAADGHGHGTHCIGTSCGPLNVANSAQPRYGIAYNATICVGKVLNNAGKGNDGDILAGINWALSQGCAVISMSLGAPTSQGGYSAVFENTAARVLNLGSLIIAAAGNDSGRPSVVKPVSHPANCPSIMAVGAVDINMNIASFSNGGIYTPYGSVDIAGPGVGVFSSTKLPAKYATMNGTSMATPHVAGIAALWAEAAGVRGSALWNKLIQTAKRLNLPARDVGAGLVQAPSKSIFKPIPVPFPIVHNGSLQEV